MSLRINYKLSNLLTIIGIVTALLFVGRIVLGMHGTNCKVDSSGPECDPTVVYKGGENDEGFVPLIGDGDCKGDEFVESEGTPSFIGRSDRPMTEFLDLSTGKTREVADVPAVWQARNMPPAVIQSWWDAARNILNKGSRTSPSGGLLIQLFGLY